MDINSGFRTSFWQLMLDKDSRPLTSFSCTSGQFQWICMSMGLLVALLKCKDFRNQSYRILQTPTHLNIPMLMVLSLHLMDPLLFILMTFRLCLLVPETNMKFFCAVSCKE